MTSSIDIEFIDNFRCLNCHEPLTYKPMEFLDGAEIGECLCRATFCARSREGLKGMPGQPVRDLVMNLHGWSIMVPCHGLKSSWGATPRDIPDGSSVAKIVACSNISFHWAIKLPEIPEFFRQATNIFDVIDHLELWLPFI